MSENGKLNYFIDEFDDQHNINSKYLQIDRLNGTLYFDMSNFTSHFELFKFKKVLNVTFYAKDCGSPSHTTSTNITLFFNYELNELPPDLMNDSDLDELDESNSNLKLYSLKSKNHKKSSSSILFNAMINNFVFIFLMFILFLMVVIALFVLVTIYRRGITNSKQNNLENCANTNNLCLNKKHPGKANKIFINLGRYLGTDCILLNKNGASLKNLTDCSRQENLTVRIFSFRIIFLFKNNE